MELDVHSLTNFDLTVSGVNFSVYVFCIHLSTLCMQGNLELKLVSLSIKIGVQLEVGLEGCDSCLFYRQSYVHPFSEVFSPLKPCRSTSLEIIKITLMIP